MVWSNYCEQHWSLFLDYDVEGEVNEVVCEDAGILVKPGMNRSVDECLTWALEQIVDGIKDQS
jgi:hypothetical protein